MKRWPTKPLIEVCSPKQWPTVSAADLTKTGFPLYGANGQIGHYHSYNHEEPTILITCRGATCGTLNISPPRTYVTGNAMALDNPRLDIIDFRFFYYSLLERGLGDTINGAAQPQITRASLSRVSVPVPPLIEQKRIVEVLDEAEELRKLRTQADRRTAALTPALFHEMFVQADFVEKTIGQFLEQGWLLLHKDGNHGSLYPRSSDFGIEGIPFLSATCVTDEGTIDHSEVKRLAEEKAKLLRHGWIECGDVLLAHNASVGAVGFYGGDYDRAIIGTSLTAFRANPDRIEPRFLWASLRDVFFQDQLERIMKQALRNQVPITAQRELFLRIPALALQKEFAARVSEIRVLQDDQAASRCRLDELFQSMLHRAFQGEL